MESTQVFWYGCAATATFRVCNVSFCDDNVEINAKANMHLFYQLHNLKQILNSQYVN